MVRGGVPKAIDLTQKQMREKMLALLNAIRVLPEDQRDISPILRRYPSPKGTYAKSQLLGAYRKLVEEGAFDKDLILERRLKGRPVRSISGVTPVAVLTEPYPCPGSCIFCPDQEQAPKSYLDGEPGVLRAIQNKYDPYQQTDVRINALKAIGHPTDKVELLVLGGTWSYYEPAYREQFLRRCFDALNRGPVSHTLSEALLRNETAPHRNVGLVIETRPDWISPQEVLNLRLEGVTKVQLGAQSLDDRILLLNQRGHTLAATRQAVRLLRLAGFKIVLHWMPNLYGATPESDLKDFARLWEDPALHPDEMKIYPTALLRDTQLYTLWQEGKYSPYDEDILTELLVTCKQLVQPYTRINRLMRDIPAPYIVAGTTKSNLRQIVQLQMQKRNLACQCIRCREVRGKEDIIPESLSLQVVSYKTDVTQEHFLQYLTSSGHLVGFLRLSLPDAPRTELPLPEIRDAAMIRELHVYGPAQALGRRDRGGQHQGLGKQLLDMAAQMSYEAGYRELAVIAAVGTRPYYRERGFTEGSLYPIQCLSKQG